METLEKFIREHKEQIVREWVATASGLPHPPHVTASAIRDHIPEILECIAETVERHDQSGAPLKGLPNLHASLRRREGYDLRQIVAEYRALRRVICELYSSQGDISDESRPKLASLLDVNAALDSAIGDAVDQYAVERDRAREMFIGILGHDLRDPLNTISFSARTLWERGDDLDAHTLKTAARIGASSKRMETMIRDLLDFARGHLGVGFPINAEPMNARSVIRDVLEEIAQAHPERSIHCAADVSAGNFDVSWDRDRFAQAIANLVSNAVTHGHDPIVVEPCDRGNEISIEVRNRGEIPASALRHLFEPFADPVSGEGRAERSDSAQRHGLGLGLYIVREIVAAHGGGVEAQSRNGETIFRMILPRHPDVATVTRELKKRQVAAVENRRSEAADRRKALRSDRRRTA